MSQCPSCGGASGKGAIRAERGDRREDVQGVCDGCVRSLERRRAAADALCLGPLVLGVALGAALGVKPLVIGAAVYGLFLGLTLGYTWADAALYGRRLGKGATLPVGSAHVFARLGVIAAVVLALGVTAAAWPTEAPPSPAPPVTLLEARALHVPVRSPGGSELAPIEVRQRDGFLVKSLEAFDVAPPGRPTTTMNGGELVFAFLATDARYLVVELGGQKLVLDRAEAQRLRPAR